MPKIKTHKGTAKRIVVTKNGKLLRRRAYSNHFLTKKSSTRKRAYALEYEVKGTVKKSIQRMLGAKGSKQHEN
jgi:large subunit ribosomal protein L35